MKDKRSKERVANREKRIRESGLSHLKVIMHKDDAPEIRGIAKEMYEKRGYSLKEKLDDDK